MKKIVTVVVSLLLVMALSGCWAGDVNSGLTITSAAGAGYKTLRIEILKDHVEKPDKNGKVDDNSDYFPNGMNAVTKFLKKSVPAGFKIGFREEKNKYVYSVTYSFKDIKDYNAKTKQLIGSKVWAEKKLKDATITSVAAAGGKKVTFKEDASLTATSVLEVIKKVYLNPDVFDPTHGGHEVITIDQVYALKGISAKVGNSAVKTFDMTVKGKPVTTIQQTGFIKTASK
ncbi:hypothetical protein [Paenibacillus montanisoli]|uniref:Uncharacterized protein n=1 Tax=Paenibacillus montanisoli TaxID=2081970 RepID=A0A328TUR2_9BACL|nr:hypothetical protein [Paenibacillus montanisoli]RAP74070.1 hypothetical protein DL346_23645 [Paenibacillus montanisoli]